MRFFAVYVFAFAAVGCELIIGVEERKADPRLPGCALPARGDGRMRVGNLVPSADKVDFCVRQTGAASYGRPILAGDYTECAAGFSYEDLSATFGVPTGKVDVKAIPFGRSCDETPTAEATKIAVPSAASVTVVLAGGSAGPWSLLVLTDSVHPSGNEFRVVNAMADSAPMHLGFAKDGHLPTSIETPLTSQAIAFLQTTSSANVNPGLVTNATGYLTLPIQALTLGLAYTGQSDATVVAVLPNPLSFSSHTLFAIGTKSDLKYPERGLLCEDKLDAPKSVKANCIETEPPLLTIDLFNTDYNGGFPYDEERLAPMAKAIAERNADFVCLSNLGQEKYREAILASVKDAYPHVHAPVTNRDTPVDRRDQNGNIPPEPTTPPCSGSVLQAEVDNVVSCVQNNCLTSPDDSGILKDPSGACLSTACGSAFSPLYSGDLDHKKCHNCLQLYLQGPAYKSLAEARDSCTTDPASLNIDGRQQMILFSRMPFAETDFLLMPSSVPGRRYAVLYAQIKLPPNDKRVDVYCAETANPSSGSSFPYTGPYALPGSTNGYADEQLLHADKVIAWVHEKSGDHPAIIAGQWTSGGRFPADPALPAVVDDYYPEAQAKLRGAFIPAEPPDFVPSCSVCYAPENPYRKASSASHYFDNATFLLNFDKGATQAGFRSFDEFILPLPPGNTYGVDIGPLSRRFGWTIQVIRPK